MTPTDVITQWFDRVWNSKDPSAIDDLMDISAAAQGLGASLQTGPVDFRNFWEAMYEHFAEIQITLDKIIEQGEWASAHFTVTGESPSQDAPVVFTGQSIIRAEDGKIAEAYNAVDFMSMFEQLDLLPQNALRTCFSGNRIG